MSLLPYTNCTAHSRESTRLVRVERALPHAFYECTELLTGKVFVFHICDLTPMQTIPSRFREHLFAQVAPHIGAALDAYPNAIRIDPHPLAVDTFRRRLLEAKQAKVLYSWKHPSINEEKWAEHYEEIEASIEQNGTILFGPKKAKAKEVGKKSEVPFSAAPAEITLVSIDELETVCRLLHRKVLSPVPIIRVAGLTEEQRSSLEGRYDVAIIPLESDSNISQIMA